MILAESPALQHTQDLKDYILKQIINKNGRISFSEYMQHALYAPGLGYYNAGTQKFGFKGDFMTAPELGAIFAKCVGVQVIQILEQYSAPVILELGAGSGRFACDLLSFLNAHDMLPQQYLILELSPYLRWQQQELIHNIHPELAHRVQWLDQLPKEPINGVIFANEVMDAMPVSKFHFNDNVLQEYYVTHKDDAFAYHLDLPTPQLDAMFKNYKIAEYIAQPYTSEINLWLNAWINSLSACLHTGAILLCDYGFARAQYYHPQRNTGTFICHYQHQTLTNPFINIGLQDLTAHVDFTAVAEAGSANDLYVAGYTNLAGFLINCGITNFLDPSVVTQTREVNILTSPAEMGELFKVIMLTRMQGEDFVGFRSFDKTHTL